MTTKSLVRVQPPLPIVMSKKKLKPQIFVIRTGIYSDVLVSCGVSFERHRERHIAIMNNGFPSHYKRRLTPEDFDPPGDSQRAVTYTQTRWSFASIWFREVQPPASLVAHETLHATAHMLRQIGMPLTPDSEEAYTYLQQYLIKEIANRAW